MSIPLTIPKTKKDQGLRVKCACKGCNGRLVNNYGEEKGRRCNKGEKQRYIMFAYESGNGSKQHKKILLARTYALAQVEAKGYLETIKSDSLIKKELINLSSPKIDEIFEIVINSITGFSNESEPLTTDIQKIINNINKIKNEMKTKSENKALSENLNASNDTENAGDWANQVKESDILVDLIGEYFIYKTKQLSEDYSSKTLDRIKELLNSFTSFLVLHKINLSTFSIFNLRRVMIKDFYELLANTPTNRGTAPANATMNGYKRDLIAFENWLLKEKNLDIVPLFKKLETKKVKNDKNVIDGLQYRRILDFVEVGFWRERESNKKRSHYKPWTVTGIRLGAQTGCRMEEIVELKHSSILAIKDKKYIKTPNIKINRQKRYKKEEEMTFTYVPVSKGMIELLEELEHEKYKGTDRYLLAPEILKNRLTAARNSLPYCFNIAYKKTGGTEKITFKNLRKTFCTALEVWQGKDRNAGIHQDKQTAIKYYFNDKKLIAELYGWHVFPEIDDPKLQKKKP